MERLTEKLPNGKMVLTKNYTEVFNPQIGRYIEGDAIDKLATYENAEENGLLLMMPCKVGDKIYRFWYADDKPYKVQEQEIKTLSNLVAIMESGEIGNTIFLTREEAEQALAEMQDK